MALDKILTMEEEINTMEDRTTKVLGVRESFKFKLTKFTEIKDKNEEFISSPFYTGYLVAIRVYPNGYEGTHTSIYAELLEGKNDTHLPWPYVGRVTSTLLNQLKDVNHYEETVQVPKDWNIRPKGTAWNSCGYNQFIPHTELSRTGNTQYLKDDILYFRVTVDMSHGKPWLQ